MRQAERAERMGIINKADRF